QAEDGIRDGHVTGVQTCALPILPKTTSTWYWATNSLPSRRKLREWSASESANTARVESDAAAARYRIVATKGSGAPATMKPIERYTSPASDSGATMARGSGSCTAPAGAGGPQPTAAGTA